VFHLAIDAERYYEGTTPGTPYVHDEIVNVYPGDHFFVAAELRDGKLRGLHYSEAAPAQGQSIELAFSQQVTSKTEHMMLLTIKSTFDVPIRYRAGMHPIEADRLLKTSTCPVRPGASVYESWPFPIDQLLLTDFVAVDPADPEAAACK
jgi:hypothetical protein